MLKTLKAHSPSWIAWLGFVIYALLAAVFFGLALPFFLNPLPMDIQIYLPLPLFLLGWLLITYGLQILTRIGLSPDRTQVFSINFKTLSIFLGTFMIALIGLLAFWGLAHLLFTLPHLVGHTTSPEKSEGLLRDFARALILFYAVIKIIFTPWIVFTAYAIQSEQAKFHNAWRVALKVLNTHKLKFLGVSALIQFLLLFPAMNFLMLLAAPWLAIRVGTWYSNGFNGKEI